MEHFRGQGHRRPWLVSDERTERVLGTRLRAALVSAGGRVTGPVLPAKPRSKPTIDLCRSLAVAARDEGADLVVAVGGGTISDIGKWVAWDLGVPSWAAPTSPSVDAYTSGTSALVVGGYHAAVPVQASTAVVVDEEVLVTAPPLLVVSGMGDMVVKLLACADWRLARLLADEPYVAEADDAASAAARSILVAAEAGAGLAELSPLVFEACLVSGLAMQAAGGSRPAASAEHTAAHLWEIAHAASPATHGLHGFLVTVALSLVLPRYEEILAVLDTPPIPGPGPQPDLERMLAPERMPAALAPYRKAVERELAGRKDDPASVSERRRRFGASPGRALSPYRRALPELRLALALIEEILGSPLRRRRLIDPALLSVTEEAIPFLRSRYGLLDLWRELNVGGRS